MKRYLPFFILALAISAIVFSVVYMNEEQPLLIYYDGASIIQNEYASVEEGKAEVLFNYNPVVNTVMVLSPKDFISYSIKKLLQTVRVVASDSNGKVHEGILVSNYPLSIKTEEGIVVVSDVVSVLYKGIESLDEANQLTLFLPFKSGSTDVLFSYITSDISWKPVLTVDEGEGAKINVKLLASVNNKGKPLKGRVKFITQQILPYNIYYHSLYKSLNSYEVEGSGYSSRISPLGERYSYAPSYEVVLDNDTTIIPLNEGTEDFYTYYAFTVPSYYSDETIHPNKHIVFKNTFAPLPVDSEVQYFVGSNYMNTLALKEDVPLNHDVDLDVSSAFDIVANTTIVSDEQSYEGRVIRYQVRIKNYKNSTAVVRSIYNAYGNWRLIAESEEHSKVSANEIYWEQSLGPGEQKKLDFTIVYNTKYVYEPMVSSQERG